jgi:hypothetical protein
MVFVILTSSALSEDEVVGTEQLTKRTGTDSVHGARLEIDENGTGNIFVASGLCRALVDCNFHIDGGVGAYLVEIHAHALKLEIGSAMIANSRLDTVSSD